MRHRALPNGRVMPGASNTITPAREFSRAGAARLSGRDPLSPHQFVWVFPLKTGTLLPNFLDRRVPHVRNQLPHSLR